MTDSKLQQCTTTISRQFTVYQFKTSSSEKEIIRTIPQHFFDLYNALSMVITKIYTSYLVMKDCNSLIGLNQRSELIN